MSMRRHERFGVYIVTEGNTPKAHLQVKVVNVSESGCRVECDGETVALGSTIRLCLSDEMEVAGRVVWSEAQAFGVEFFKLIGERMVDRLASAAPSCKTRDDRFFRSLPLPDGKAA